MPRQAIALRLFQSPSCRGRRAPHDKLFRPAATTVVSVPFLSGQARASDRPGNAAVSMDGFQSPSCRGRRAPRTAARVGERGSSAFQSPSCRGRRAPHNEGMVVRTVNIICFSPLPVGAGARLKATSTSSVRSTGVSVPFLSGQARASAMPTHPLITFLGSFSPLPVGAGARLHPASEPPERVNQFQSPSCRGRRAPLYAKHLGRLRVSMFQSPSCRGRRAPRI